ncbi:helix-turn-helix transcriptional regulator [Aeromonas simiae]|uniref:LuxR family transcriptional regulator n=1 Tax=Aeromonas simiae TaxID=218936 RepID=A0A5J6X1N9_9GAMM|nr:LuxR family transcriptional regulator [Aeromonas simiae]QFI56327.1 LuxR family transcriptional regulator [Aeromonas simiae]
MFNEELLQLVEPFAKARSPLDTQSALERFSYKMGFDYFQLLILYPCSLQRSHIVLINNYPKSWFETYYKNKYLMEDPVINLAMRQTQPIFWNTQDLMQSDISEKGKNVMKLAADFGVQNGISIPLNSPTGEKGVLTFITKVGNNSELMYENVPKISFCSGYIFSSALEVIKRRPDIAPPSVSLSGRERECLYWASEGKTSWEIATILGITERTVNFHLNQVTTKTDSRNRNQAIAKTISSGLIVPSLENVTMTNLRLS